MALLNNPIWRINDAGMTDERTDEKRSKEKEKNKSNTSADRGLHTNINSWAHAYYIETHVIVWILIVIVCTLTHAYKWMYAIYIYIFVRMCVQVYEIQRYSTFPVAKLKKMSQQQTQRKLSEFAANISQSRSLTLSPSLFLSLSCVLNDSPSLIHVGFHTHACEHACTYICMCACVCGCIGCMPMGLVSLSLLGRMLYVFHHFAWA